MPPELNEDWEDILWRLDLLLSPLKASFKAALPEVEDEASKHKVGAAEAWQQGQLGQRRCGTPACSHQGHNGL